MLNAEMDHHLGQDDERVAGNHRNIGERCSLESCLAFAIPVGTDLNGLSCHKKTSAIEAMSKRRRCQRFNKPVC
jgi:hypothetical protein